MRIVFEVGVTERHQVEVSYDQVTGRWRILVDGHTALDRVRHRSLSLIETHVLTVGVGERHTLRVDKHRKLLFPGLRPQTIIAYVDDREVARASTGRNPAAAPTGQAAG